MKHLLVICVLAAILISLQAAPMRNAWFELVQAQKLLKGVGDIWSDCSEYCCLHGVNCSVMYCMRLQQ